MKLKVGTKLKVTLTGGVVEAGHGIPVPCTGQLVVTGLANEGREVQSCNFIRDDDKDETIIGIETPLFKLIKTRHPYREIRVQDKEVPWGVSSSFRVRVWPNGVIEVIEHGRRSGYSTMAGRLYVRLMQASLAKPKKARKLK